VGNLHGMLRDLQRRKARERRGLVVAEGRRLVADALAARAKVRAVLAADDVAEGPVAPLLAEARARGIAVEVCGRKEFQEFADTDSPSGVLAVVEWGPAALGDVRLPEGPAVVLVLDAVQDPGNVGTMIRTAFALGADLTVALDGSADLRNAKTLRAAMGAVFRHPVAHAHAAECLDFLAAQRVELWAATTDGERIGCGAVGAGHGTSAHERAAPTSPAADAASAAAAPVPPRLALAVGNEGAGLRPELLSRAARRVAVPMRETAESLNAAVAAGILLHQVLDAR
jgi:TrmH family RNA methyltransferase